MPRLAFALAGAAAVVVFAAVALNFYANQSGIGGHSTPSPSPATTRAPSAAPSPTELGLSSGCVNLYDSGGTYSTNVGSLVVSATVPKGWTGTGDGFYLGNASCLFGSSSQLAITLVGRVYGDACDLIGTDVEVRTPAAAIAALVAQKGHQTTGPTDVTLGGYQAARFEFSVPADFDSGSCAEGGGTGSMALWWSPGDQHLGQGLGTGVTTVYVVDIDGVSVGVVASNAGAGSEPPAVAELDAIIESLRFEPTAVPTAISEPTGAALLPEGSHVLWDRDFFGRHIIAAIPAPDWYGEPGGGVLEKHDNSGAPDGAGLVVFAGPSRLFPHRLYVYGDPCHWSTTTPASPVTTVDEVVTALASQASRDASVPMDVTVGGYAGKAITLHVPDDAVFSDCDQGEFRTLVSAWDGSGDFIEDESRTGTLRAQDPGQIDTLWIFHVEEVGLVMIDAAYYDGTPQSVVDELIAIVESVSVSGTPI